MEPPEKSPGEPRYPGQYRLDKNSRALFIGIGVFWACLAARNWVPTSVGYGIAVERAEAIHWLRPSSLFHPYDPFGYPLVLRILFTVVRDYRLVGPLLSIASGLACLLGLDVLWQRFGMSRRLRLLALAVVGLEFSFTSAAITPGTTMLYPALLTLACLPFCRRDWSQRDAFRTGLVVGLGCLIQYRLAWFLAAGFIRLICSREPTPRRTRIALALGLGFLLPICLQLGVNLAATGNPLGQDTIMLAYLSNHEDTGFWDVTGLALSGNRPELPPVGAWLLPAPFGNAEYTLQLLGQVSHVWGLLLVPGLWWKLRGLSGWAPIRTYALVNGVFLLPLVLSRPDKARVLFVLLPAVFLGLWFLAGELVPWLTPGSGLRRRLRLTVLALGIGGLGVHDLVQLGTMKPEAVCNLELDRFLEQIEVDPGSELFQVGTGFCQCRSPRPFLYPMFGGNPPSTELTLNRLKDMLKDTGYGYLLAGRSSYPFGFPELWGLRERLAIDPNFELIESWDRGVAVSLYRLRWESDIEGTVKETEAGYESDQEE